MTFQGVQKCDTGLKWVKDTLTYLEELESDIDVVRTVNDRLIERLVKTEKHFWEHAQYSRRDTLEIIGIPNSVDNSVREEMVPGVFKQIGVETDERDVQTCHRLKEKKRIIAKFVNWIDCL